MVRFLLRILIFLVSAALGLLVAWWLLPEMHVTVEGFFVTVVVFAIVQSILTPFLASIASRNARAFLGGVGLVATFLGLLVAALLPGGLTIDDWRTWVLATLVVWLVTATATFLLPLFLIKKKVKSTR
jgi:hypothetical protein